MDSRVGAQIIDGSRRWPFSSVNRRGAPFSLTAMEQLAVP